MWKPAVNSNQPAQRADIEHVYASTRTCSEIPVINDSLRPEPGLRWFVLFDKRHCGCQLHVGKCILNMKTCIQLLAGWLEAIFVQQLSF